MVCLLVAMAIIYHTVVYEWFVAMAIRLRLCNCEILGMLPWYRYVYDVLVWYFLLPSVLSKFNDTCLFFFNRRTPFQVEKKSVGDCQIYQLR